MSIDLLRIGFDGRAQSFLAPATGYQDAGPVGSTLAQRAPADRSIAMFAYAAPYGDGESRAGSRGEPFIPENPLALSQGPTGIRSFNASAPSIAANRHREQYLTALRVQETQEKYRAALRAHGQLLPPMPQASHFQERVASTAYRDTLGTHSAAAFPAGMFWRGSVPVAQGAETTTAVGVSGVAVPGLGNHDPYRADGVAFAAHGAQGVPRGNFAVAALGGIPQGRWSATPQRLGDAPLGSQADYRVAERLDYRITGGKTIHALSPEGELQFQLMIQHHIQMQQLQMQQMQQGLAAEGILPEDTDVPHSSAFRWVVRGSIANHVDQTPSLTPSRDRVPSDRRRPVVHCEGANPSARVPKSEDELVRMLARGLPATFDKSNVLAFARLLADKEQDADSDVQITMAVLPLTAPTTSTVRTSTTASPAAAAATTSATPTASSTPPLPPASPTAMTTKTAQPAKASRADRSRPRHPAAWSLVSKLRQMRDDHELTVTDKRGPKAQEDVSEQCLDKRSDKLLRNAGAGVLVPRKSASILERDATAQRHAVSAEAEKRSCRQDQVDLSRNDCQPQATRTKPASFSGRSGRTNRPGDVAFVGVHRAAGLLRGRQRPDVKNASNQLTATQPANGSCSGAQQQDGKRAARDAEVVVVTRSGAQNTESFTELSARLSAGVELSISEPSRKRRKLSHPYPLVPPLPIEPLPASLVAFSAAFSSVLDQAECQARTFSREVERCIDFASAKVSTLRQSGKEPDVAVERLVRECFHSFEGIESAFPRHSFVTTPTPDFAHVVKLSAKGTRGVTDGDPVSPNVY